MSSLLLICHPECITAHIRPLDREKRIFFSLFSLFFWSQGSDSGRVSLPRQGQQRCSRAEDMELGLNERIKTGSHGQRCYFWMSLLPPHPRPTRLPPASCPFPRAALPLFHRRLPLRPTHTAPAGDLAVGQLTAVSAGQTVWKRRECGNVISVIPFPSHCAMPGIMPTACWENTSSLATGVRLCSQSAAAPPPTLPRTRLFWPVRLKKYAWRSWINNLVVHRRRTSRLFSEK